MQPIVRQRDLFDTTLDDLPSVLQRIYNARGIKHRHELDASLQQLLPASQLLHADLAAQRLFEAIEQQQKVVIVGDYDADGATSCAVAIRALRAFGLQQVDYLVPSRFTDGYGLSPKIVEVAKQSGADIIVTVDNGISSVAGVQAARQSGIDVLITDHHLPGDELPNANVIVNPNQRGDSFASKALAGVGVIFYIMLMLRATLRERDWFVRQNIDEPNLADLLDIVALGTVADVVPLDRNNRILIEQGLRRIRAGKAHAGVNALIQVAGRDRQFLRAADIGFAVAPRLNAAGRLADMSVGIECLLTDDGDHAMRLASQLDEMNRERRAIGQDMEEEALLMLQELQLNGDKQPPVHCLHQAHWHQGIIGILAGRVKEKTHRPAIVFADGDNGDLKGSARSINGFHIRDALEAVAHTNPGLITKFGGHAMAAGLTLPAENFTVFAQCMREHAQATLDDELLQNVILTDGALEEDEINMQVAQLIEQGGPWGQGFPEPLFEGRFKVVGQGRVGAERRHVKCRLLADGAEVEAIAFNVPETVWPENSTAASIIYRITVNRYRGFENVQLIIQNVLDVGI